jgi:uncharacterized membrane protein YkvA (DUF1232 family)
MANNGNGSRAKAGANGREFDTTREWLEEKAARIDQKDIDALDTSVPKKLKSRQMQELKEGLGWVQELVGRAQTLFDMIRDREFRISGKSKTLIAAGLIYLVLPTDFVPDFIPGLGYIDDALVLSTLWKIVESQIESYMAFRGKSPSQS